MQDAVMQDSNVSRRYWRENLAIILVTGLLFFLTSYGRLHERLHELVVRGSPGLQMRSVSAADNDVDGLMTFGLVASLGLSAFAFLQYGRVNRALHKQQEAETRLRRLVLSDGLTGLSNRRAFEMFGDQIAVSGTAALKRAVLLIDLDNFKPVNDIHGHVAGDVVLKDFASRIKDQFPGGIVTRFGGDEFAVITPVLANDDQALQFAEKCLVAAREPFLFCNIDLHVGASVGVAVIEPGTVGTAEALRRADIALYEAKRSGRQRAALYGGGLELDIRERSWIEAELRQALKEKEIVPFFQPIVDLTTRETVGFEALARWRHRTRGLISPAEFIPVAESFGMIRELGDLLLKQATAIAKNWPHHILLSVNLSPVQLRDKDLAQRILDVLSTNDFPASRLEVEITENALISDLELARDTIIALRAAGVSVALDDFGTGASTLNHLRVCQFDKIKIDRSFVQSMNSNRDSRTIVTSILDLSRNFGLKCTAEGIENAKDLDILTSWGCAEGQGFLFGKPQENTAFDQKPSLSGTVANLA